MGKLVLTEIAKKQQYIFKSNRLKENIGASLIIRKVTEVLPMEINETLQKKGEKILIGGGKSFFYFEEKEAATEFAKIYSKKVLEMYPGVELFLVSIDMDKCKDLISEKITEAYKALGSKKSKCMGQFYQLSFGKEIICSSSGMPAVEFYTDEDEIKYLSEEILAKMNMAREADTQFKKVVNLDISPAEIMKGIDELGKEAGKKYMAVIHIDGNKMGKRFEALKKECTYGVGKTIKEINIDYSKRMGDLGEAIDKAYKEAFRQVRKKTGKIVRPLILAGDDVCLICSAIEALEISCCFMEALSEQKISGQATLHASAGIAIVRDNYPFSRAYQLAEELCQACKSKVIDEKMEDCNMLDWHIMQGEFTGSLKQIRENFYQCKGYSLTLKPLIADNSELKRYDTYSNFKEIQKTLEDAIKQKNNKVARSKIKALREVYPLGKEQVEIFMKVNGIELKNGGLKNKLDFAGNYRCEYGFYQIQNKSVAGCYEDVAAYYDAIEMMDFIHPDEKIGGVK